MEGEGPEVIHEGAAWVLGRDSAGYGIWRRTPGLAISGEPAARFDSTAEGLASASQLMNYWESLTPASAVPMDTAGPNPELATTTTTRSRWWWTLPIGVFVVLGVVAALLFAHSSSPQTTNSAAVGRNASSTTTAPPVGSGYLSSSSTDAIFIQWNRNGNSVSGTAQDDYIQGTAPSEMLSTNTINVAGQVNGSTISLSFNSGTQEFGTISGGSFTLNFPQPDGSLAPVTFSSSDPSAFNAAVASLHTTLTDANNYEAAVEATQKQEAQINSDISTVNGDISSLNQVSFSSETQPLSGELQQAQSDVGTTTSQAQMVEGEAGSQNQCSDAGNAESDAGNVSSDAGNVSSTASQVESSVVSVRNAVQQIGTDLQQLQTDQAQLPTYQPTAPGQSDVDAAVAAANQSINVAVGTTNAAINQVNGDVTTAYQAASQAEQSGGCGSGYSAPNPIAQIS